MQQQHLTVSDITTHVSELLILPFASVCAVASYGCLIGLTWAPSMPISAIVGIVFVALTTVVTSLMVGVFRLPILTHSSGLIIMAVTAILFDSSIAFCTILAVTWVAALLMGTVCAVAVPADKMQHDDEHMSERLEELRLEHEVYHRARTDWLLQNGWSRTLLLLISAVSLWGVGHGMGLTQLDPVRTIYLNQSAGMLLFSLLVFYGLLQLVARKNRWESDQSMHTDARLGTRWPLTVLGGALVLVLVGLTLPSDISPLYVIDWNSLMNDLTVTLFGSHEFERMGTDPSNVALPPPSPILPSTMPGGSGFAGVGPLLYTVAVVGILIWVVWQTLSFVLRADLDRAKGAGSILKAIVRLPLTLILLLWRAFSVRIGSGGSTRMGGIRSPKKRQRKDKSVEEEDLRSLPVGVATIRRLFLLLLVWAYDQGTPRRAEQTVTEYAEHLATQLPQMAQEINFVASAYQNVRYSKHDAPDSTVERVRACFERIVGNKA